MRQRRIGETAYQRIAIGAHVDSCRNLQRGRDLFVHEAAHERDKVRLCGDLVDVFMSGKKSEISKCRMARIQQAELHRLERHDIGDELRAADFPARSRRNERVLDHPLLEWLKDNRRGIVHPERCVVVANVRRGRRRDDSIDHCRRKRRVLFDPCGKRPIARLRKRRDETTQDAAVVRKVVAANDRQRSRAIVPSRFERRYQQSHDARRLM